MVVTCGTSGGEFGTTTVAAGASSLVGAIAIVHSITYRFDFSRNAMDGFHVAFPVLGAVTMVHGETMVQVSALGAVVALYIARIVAGNPHR